MSKGAEKRAFFRALTSAVGIRPRLVRKGPDGGEPLRTETVTWHKGNVSLYAVYRDGGTNAAGMDLELPAEVHVFDLRKGEIGKTRHVQLNTLKPGYAHFLAAYPFDPGQPEIKLSAKRAKGGEVVRAGITMSKVPRTETGIFSYETRLLAPDGRRVEAIPWSAQGIGGRAETRIRFAHSDPEGAWILHVREVTTGRKTTARIEKVR